MPKPSPLTASLAGLFGGTSIALIRLSNQTYGGGLSGLIILILGGLSLFLFVAFVGGFGQFLNRRGWEPIMRWYFYAFLYGACALAAWILIETTIGGPAP